MLTETLVGLALLVGVRAVRRARADRAERSLAPPLDGPRFRAPGRPHTYATWPTFTQPPVDPAEEALKAFRAYDADLSRRIATLREEERRLRTAAARVLGSDGGV